MMMATVVKNYKFIVGIVFGIVGSIIISFSNSTRVQTAIVILWVTVYAMVILYSIYIKTNVLNTRMNNIKRTIVNQETKNAEAQEYVQKQIGLIARQINVAINDANVARQESNNLYKSSLRSSENMHKIIMDNQAKILVLCEETAQHSRSKPEPYTLISERRESTLTNSPGRMAAAVASDRMRSKRLAEALGSFDPQKTSARRIAVVGSERLLGFLEARSSVVSLRPSECVEQIQVFRPDLLVIEERALIHGLWAGALSSSGIALFDEIYKVISIAKQNKITVVVIRNYGVPDINTPQLLENAFVIDKDTVLLDEWSEGYHLKTLESLRTYCIEK